MDFIAFPLYIFLELLLWLIYIEIFLSLLSLLGILVAIPFISRIVQPMFEAIARILPTQFMGLDFSPIILIISIWLVKWVLITVSPIIVTYLPSLSFF